jgi:hypothetical protein
VTHSRRGKDGYVGFFIHFVDGFFFGFVEMERCKWLFI